MIIVNEKQFLDNLLETKNLGDNPRQSLSLYSRHLFSLGKKPREVREELKRFIQECDLDLYKVMAVEWNDFFEKLTKKPNRKPLSETLGVSVTRPEMDMIEKLEDAKCQRLMFTLLCLAKLNHLKNPSNDGWVNQSNFAKLFKLANVRTKNAKERGEYLNKLYTTGLIDLPKNSTVINLKVNQMDFENEGIIFLEDISQLGMEYQLYQGDNHLRRCKECGKIFNAGSRNKPGRPEKAPNIKAIYCKDCQYDRLKESWRSSKRRSRSGFEL